MSAINDFHRKAMDFAALALMERSRGNIEAASAVFEQALENELAAIKELEELGSMAEPTYSVLHRSAGTLALDCNQFRLAEQLAAKGLAHTPHADVAEELRDLLGQIDFQRHLELKGVELGEGEIQVSLAGRGVGYGTARLSDFTRVVSNFETLVYRIVERARNLPFRERGRPIKGIQDGYQPFASVPRPGSFAVSLKLGRPVGQLSFPGMIDTDEIISEFLDLMDLVNRSRITELKERIPEPSYLRNFLGLAKNMAPDGKRIRQVGFTAMNGGATRSVSVTRPALDFPMPPPEEPPSSKTVEISGVLRYADATRGSGNQIRVVSEGGDQYVVAVPSGMMNDIVRPMWDSDVIISGVLKGKVIVLHDIRESDTDLSE